MNTKETMKKKTIKKEKKPINKKLVAPEPKLEDDKLDQETINNLLIELSYSKFWKAIIFMNNGWLTTIENALRTIDPFKEPTQMARGQGQTLALKFLPDYIDGRKKILNEKESGENVN